MAKKTGRFWLIKANGKLATSYNSEQTDALRAEGKVLVHTEAETQLSMFDAVSPKTQFLQVEMRRDELEPHGFFG